ncbi:hypothetical protein NBRC116602_13480 [Hyphomicrobiales bacterium 4NK60-0047b]
MTHKSIKYFSLVFGLLFITPQAAFTKEKLRACLQLPEGMGVVKEISKKNVITLKGGKKLVMANIYEQNPESHQFMKKKLMGKKISFYSSGRLKDRYNRLIVQIVYKDGKVSNWLQETLIEKGFAATMALPTNWICAIELLKIENLARDRTAETQNLNFHFPILKAENTKSLNQKQQGSFQLVKGKVLSISRTTQNTYINFSKNWRKDFTAVISNHLLKRKKSRWPKLKLLKGKTIILRGWLDHYNGPLIRLETPEMIEIMN